MLTGSAHGQVYAHCVFVIRNIAFIPHGAPLFHCSPACRRSLCAGKAHFLASNKPTEMVLRGLSSSDSNGMSQLLNVAFLHSTLSHCCSRAFDRAFAQLHAWHLQLLPPPCIATRSLLRSGAAARSTASSVSMWLLTGSSARARSHCSCSRMALRPMSDAGPCTMRKQFLAVARLLIW